MAENKTLTQTMFVEEDSPPIPEKGKSQKAPDPVISSDVTNIVDIPSGGVLGYPATVEYREVLVKDEEVLATATNKTYSRTLNKVLKSVLNDCPFYDDMSIHDRDFLLVWVWATNYQSTKDVSVKCAHCGTTSDHVVDFSKLDITPLNPKFKGYYEMQLKAMEHPVKIRLNTVRDEMTAEEYLVKNPNARYDHILLVLSIDFGIPLTLDKRIELVGNKISGREMAKIKQFHAKLRFGIDSEIEYKCKNVECGEVTKDAFPFHTEDILFPTVPSDTEEFL